MGCRGVGDGEDTLEPGPVGAEVWDGRPRLRPGFTVCDTTFTTDGSDVPIKC